MTRLLIALVVLALAACASPQRRSERDALATFNRCVVAVKEMNQALYDLCLSGRLKREHAAKAEQNGYSDAEQILAAYRDSRPWQTRVRGISVAEDLSRVEFDTVNYTGLLDQQVEHEETIVLIPEDGRWVIDKECCDYAASRFVSE